MDEILSRFEQNHKKFLEKVQKQSMSVGAQMLEAGQYAEFEAYTEVFGKAFGEIYKGALGRLIGFDTAYQCRLDIQKTELNSVIEDFKVEFKSILSSLSGLSFLEALRLTMEVQRCEAKLGRELIGRVERRYKLSYWSVGEDDIFLAPDGAIILGFSLGGFIGGRGPFVIGFEEII